MTQTGPQKAEQIKLFSTHYTAPKEFRLMVNLNAMMEPGMIVRNPDRPDWGLGQVQSNVGGRVTVNFREAGKVVIAGDRIALVLVLDDDIT